jgi:hypothetical protein
MESLPPQSTSSPSPFAPDRRQDMLLGMGILVGAFLSCIGISLWAMHLSTPGALTPPEPPVAANVPGFPNRVRPFELVGLARTLTERKVFVGFSVKGLNRDGSVDLTQESSSVRYSFQDPRGLGAQPPRRGGTLPVRTYCGKQSVRLAESGLGAMWDNPASSCPGAGPAEIPEPSPRCGAEQLWKLAEKRRVPTSGTAQIDYFRARVGPIFRFKHGNQQFSVLASDCRTIVRGADEHGSVP